MSRDLDVLEDLFELVFERTGSVGQALRSVLEAEAASRAESELNAEISRRGPQQKKCAWCERSTRPAPRSSAPPIDDITRRRAHRASAVVAAVAARHGFTLAQIRSRRRDGKICPARFEAYWELRQLNHSLKAIARATGRRDHNAVISGLRRFEGMAPRSDRRPTPRNERINS